MRNFFKLYNIRINRLSLAIIVYCIILLSSFFNVQIIQNNEIKKVVTKKGWKSKKIYGERGKIFDTNNENLAISITKYNF